jgi:hypothetical protein
MKVSISKDPPLGQYIYGHGYIKAAHRALIVEYIERDDTTYFHSITIVQG